MSLKSLLDEYERGLIRSALAASDGHQRRAASALGLLPSTLNEKMKRLGLRAAARSVVPRDTAPVATADGP